MDVNIFDVTEDSDKKIFPSPAVSKIRQGYFGKKNDEYGRTVQKPNIKSYIVRFFPLRVHVYKREYLRANMSKNPEIIVQSLMHYKLLPLTFYLSFY